MTYSKVHPGMCVEGMKEPLRHNTQLGYCPLSCGFRWVSLVSFSRNVREDIENSLMIIGSNSAQVMGVCPRFICRWCVSVVGAEHH